MNEKNKLVKKEEPKIFALLESKTGDLCKVLPKSITPEKAMRLVLTCLRKNKQLADAAEENPLSLLGAVTHIFSLGLNVDGRHAHLIPFKSKRPPYKPEVVAVIDYKGYVQLVLRSRQYSFIHADVVCENDEFEFNLGQVTRHVIDFKRDRGDAYAYYTMVKSISGELSFCVMSKTEVEAIRARAPGKDADAWVKSPDEMGKKSVFKRHCKWLELAPEVAEAIENENTMIYDPMNNAAKPVFENETGWAEPQDAVNVEAPTNAPTPPPSPVVPPTQPAQEQIDPNVGAVIDRVMKSGIDPRFFVDAFIENNLLAVGQGLSDISPAYAKAALKPENWAKIYDAAKRLEGGAK